MDRQQTHCCGARVDCANCGIRPIAICGALAPIALGKLAAIAGSRRVDAGAQLIQEGEPAEDIFTLTEGMLKIYKLMPDGRRQITGFLIPGDLVGLAYGDSYIYSAEAVTDIVACRFRRSNLLALMTDHPELEHRLLSRAGNELAAAQAQMLLLGRKTARERVASFLLGLAERRGTKTGEPMPLPMNRGDIADFLGLTIETVSRTLTLMRKAGLIILPDKHSVTITDLASLRAASGD
ncbi:MAG: helix-turn-helix domain-containing protein [Geminicoccaceae bacterium]